MTVTCVLAVTTFKDERRDGLGLTLKMKGGTAFRGTIPPLFTINTRSREC